MISAYGKLPLPLKEVGARPGVSEPTRLRLGVGDRKPGRRRSGGPLSFSERKLKQGLRVVQDANTAPRPASEIHSEERCPWIACCGLHYRMDGVI